MRGSIRVLSLLLALSPATSFADGRAVYEAVCIACHAAENVMVAAPKRGDTNEWKRRLGRSTRGIESLTEHAVDGFGAMPPKGGSERLTREEIRQAILYMMAE